MTRQASTSSARLWRAAAKVTVAFWVTAAVSAQATPPERHTVVSDGHPMAVWSRRPASARGALLLVHGRTWSSRPDFDLQVPGIQRSVLASLSARGMAAYALDLRGYGATPRDRSGWMTPRRAAADVVNVLDWIARQHRQLPLPALVGWSRGGAVAMLVAQQNPTRLSALVVFGFAYDPDGEFVEIAAPARPPRVRNTADAAAADFISPKVTPPAVVRAFVDQALRADPFLADLKNEGEFNLLDPNALQVPTLFVYGDRDPGVIDSDVDQLLERLGATDKGRVVLAGADHVAHLEDTHDSWIEAVVGFVSKFNVRR
jgi:alpha-beta hydrolase superfamily lysophospholipase